MPDPHSYSHRPKPFGQEAVLTLEKDRLNVVQGRRKGSYPYVAITEMRLSYAPTNIASDGFRAKLVAGHNTVRFGNLSWRSMAEMERHHEAYRAFAAALAARVAASNPRARLLTGLSPWRYRTMQGLAFGTGGLLVATTLFALYQSFHQDPAWPPGLARIIAGFAGLTAVYLGWWMRRYLTRNRPGSFEPGDIPQRILPPAGEEGRLRR